MSTGGVWAKHRFKIMTAYQHPYNHPVSDFFYTNEALPGVSNLESALNYILAVLYPQTKTAVANVAALPSVGNTINDFRVVSDDGDGKAAGYRWEQREGEASASWHKIFDMDWGTDSILQQFLTKTQALYLKVGGNQDLDASGVAITGLYAGQTIYGGILANSNLTLRANSGDGVGASTGYVQSDDNFRPAIDNTFTNGLATFRWANVYSTIFTAGTLTISDGSITDSDGLISFGSTNLSTTGNITGAVVTGTMSLVASSGGSTTTVTPGNIVSSTGAISFSDENLSTTGTLSSGVHTITNGVDTFVFSPNVTGKARITSSLGEISFDNENLLTTGTLTAGDTTVSKIVIDNITIDADTITKSGVGNLTISSSNSIVLTSNATSLNIDATGYVKATGNVESGSIALDNLGNITGKLVNTDIVITPDGTGRLVTAKTLVPNADNTLNLGSITARFASLFLSSGVGDGTNTISMATLLSLRDINVGVATGHSLFYDGTKWTSSAPDTEITHSTLSGLITGDAGHTQFVMLAGRSGGQTIQGGTLASQTLVLESTSNVTKGFIYLKDTTSPFTNASFSVSWSGTDLGDSTHYYRDVYTKGEHFGFRLENLGADPSPSAQNVGRLFYNTVDKLVKVDTGTVIESIGQKTHISDTSWNGSDTSKVVTVSSDVDDARKCIWQLRDNANNFEIMYPKIETSQTQVTITVNVALPVGSYRLIGIESAA